MGHRVLLKNDIGDCGINGKPYNGMINMNKNNLNDLLVCGLVSGLFVASACQHGSKTEKESGRSPDSVSVIKKEELQRQIGIAIEDMEECLRQIRDIVSSENYDKSLEANGNPDAQEGIFKDYITYCRACKALFGILYPLNFTNNLSGDRLKGLYDTLLHGKDNDESYDDRVVKLFGVGLNSSGSEFHGKSERSSLTVESFRVRFDAWKSSLKLVRGKGKRFYTWFPTGVISQLALNTERAKTILERIAVASIGTGKLSELDQEKLDDFYIRLIDLFEKDTPIPFSYFREVKFNNLIDQVKDLPKSLVKKSSVQQS